VSNRVAIVGATGLVGQAILRILEQRSFPVEELIPLASERSAGKSIRFNDQDYEVMVLDDFNFENIDFSFFSAGSSVSRIFAPRLQMLAQWSLIIPLNLGMTIRFHWSCQK